MKLKEKMLSIIIPAYREPYLNQTIDSLLENAKGEIEIIIVLDGVWTTEPIKDDPRIITVHLGRNVGMRETINKGVQVSSGEYLMRVDAHQMFAKGYDKVLVNDCQDNWIITPRRYFLDPVKWEIMKDLPPVDYMQLKLSNYANGQKFSGVTKVGNDNEQIQESMAMQGSCWVMKRSWWNKVIGELQTEGYGPLYQDSHEMVFKTWKAGGKLMVDKNTWHAHKHRSFPRSHNNGTKENPSNNDQCFKYAIEQWGDYYKELKEKWNK